jgi:hypothetical protein
VTSCPPTAPPPLPPSLPAQLRQRRLHVRHLGGGGAQQRCGWGTHTHTHTQGGLSCRGAGQVFRRAAPTSAPRPALPCTLGNGSRPPPDSYSAALRCPPHLAPPCSLIRRPLQQLPPHAARHHLALRLLRRPRAARGAGGGARPGRQRRQEEEEQEGCEGRGAGRRARGRGHEGEPGGVVGSLGVRSWGRGISGVGSWDLRLRAFRFERPWWRAAWVGWDA